jgi:hypothetical protein
VLVAIGLVAEGEDRCLDAVLQAEFAITTRWIWLVAS